MESQRKLFGYVGEDPKKDLKEYQQIKENQNAILRKLILEEGRVDILAEFVLGYVPQPFHRQMINWQSGCKRGMLLAWRGAAKCRTGDQRVLLSNGDYVPIEELCDRTFSIKAYDEVTTKLVDTIAGVKDNGVKPVLEIILGDGSKQRVTYNEPLMTKRGWVKAELLNNEDLIKTLEPSLKDKTYFWNDIKSIEKIGEHQTYALMAAKYQTYICEGVVTHNTTYCNITRCIYEILKDPNIRILLAADSLGQGTGFLRSIKSHLTTNEKFIELFGDYAKGARVWSEDKITVNKRTSHAGEPTIMCAGMGTTLPSRHFDLIICDDLVTADNALTPGQREKTLNYYYQTLFPTLEQPNGRLWVLGTRWHPDDFYDWLQTEDFKEDTLIMGVLDNEDQSRWESKFTTKDMHMVRKANLRAFEMQYMCRSTIGIDSIFSPEHFQYYDELPSNHFKWQGVDLAIGQKTVNDFFAHTTVAIDKATKDPYLIEYRKIKLKFPQQIDFIAQQWNKYPDVVRVTTEANAYQAALLQQMKHVYPEIPVVGRYTIKDKIARANQLAILFTERPLRVKRGHHDFVKLMCEFPSTEGSKDVFDALEIALAQGLRGAKKKRRNEPGLL